MAEYIYQTITKLRGLQTAPSYVRSDSVGIQQLIELAKNVTDEVGCPLRRIGWCGLSLALSECVDGYNEVEAVCIDSCCGAAQERAMQPALAMVEGADSSWQAESIAWLCGRSRVDYRIVHINRLLEAE